MATRPVLSLAHVPPQHPRLCTRSCHAHTASLVGRPFNTCRSVMSVAVPARATNPRTTGLVQPRPAASASSAGAGVSSNASSSQGSSGGSFVAAALARKAAAGQGCQQQRRQAAAPPPFAANASATAAAGPSTSGMMPPGKDTSSSAGKIFVKPSKEWVLPERAKPAEGLCRGARRRESNLPAWDDFADSGRNASRKTVCRNERIGRASQTTSRRWRSVCGQYEATRSTPMSPTRGCPGTSRRITSGSRRRWPLCRDQVKDLETGARADRLSQATRKPGVIARLQRWKKDVQGEKVDGGEIRRLQSEVAGLKVLLTQQARLGSAAYSAPSSTPFNGIQPAPPGPDGHGSRKAPLSCPICPTRTQTARPAAWRSRRGCVSRSPAKSFLAQGVDNRHGQLLRLVLEHHRVLVPRVVDRSQTSRPRPMSRAASSPPRLIAAVCVRRRFCACRGKLRSPVSSARVPITADVVPTSGTETVSVAKALPPA